MKLLQMGGYDVACSLALSQADRTRCKSRQDGSYMSDDEQPTKRDCDQFKKKTARNCVCAPCSNVSVFLHAIHTNESGDLGVDDAAG